MEDKIKVILEGFDFQKIHDYMVLTNWTWANPYGISIPSVQELKSTAAILLRSVASDEKEYSSTSTGGFVAHKFPWGLDLNFALHRRSSY